MKNEKMSQSGGETRQVLCADTLAPVLLDVIKDGGVFPLVVTGSSMVPTLRPRRDKVFLVSPRQRVPKRKDIVLFRREDGAYVLHRILKKDSKGNWKMNGDAQTWTEWILPEQIVAVVDMLERNGRRVSADSKKYRAYITFWGWCRPLRHFVFKVHGWLHSKKCSRRNET